MTAPVRRTRRSDQAWTDLAAQLTPAASLTRIDAVTARAVTTVTVVGVLLTGLGALAAGQFARNGAAARDLAAQVLTITRGLNPANLLQVQAWYHRQFTTRAYTTQAATILLILAALLAGATAATTILTT